jgi:hypothetical protein
MPTKNKEGGEGIEPQKLPVDLMGTSHYRAAGDEALERIRGIILPIEGSRVFSVVGMPKSHLPHLGRPQIMTAFDKTTFTTPSKHQVNLLENPDGGMLNFIWRELGGGASVSGFDEWFIGDRQSLDKAKRLIVGKKCELTAADAVSVSVFSRGETKITVFETLEMAVRQPLMGVGASQSVLVGFDSLYVVPASKDPKVGVEQIRKLQMPGLDGGLAVSSAPQEFEVTDLRLEAGFRKFAELLDSPPMMSSRTRH